MTEFKIGNLISVQKLVLAKLDFLQSRVGIIIDFYNVCFYNQQGRRTYYKILIGEEILVFSDNEIELL